MALKSTSIREGRFQRWLAIIAALWDLRGQPLKVSVAALIGLVRQSILAYGGGGFTSYSDSQLRNQLGGWAEISLTAVKRKIGRDAFADLDRVRVARKAIGPNVKLGRRRQRGLNPKIGHLSGISL